LDEQQRKKVISEVMRLSGHPPLGPRAGTAAKTAYRTHELAVKRELNKMTLEGIPTQFMDLAVCASKKTVIEANGTAPRVITAEPIKTRCGLWSKFLYKVYPIFASVVPKVISMAVTSAACERNWSIWGQIYADARRSSLEIIKAEMLVRIMSWYRGMKTKEDRAVSTVLCLDFVEVEEEEEV
jgi:hypothetical protein